MTGSDVTRHGLENVRPGREALTGALAGGGVPGDGRRRGDRGAERPMVPGASFDSYYGRPIIKKPVWSRFDIPAYLFLGGLAGASSVLGAGAGLTRRPALARTSKLGAVTAISLSAGALVHDLGRPDRFLNMLRVLKPTSPMSVGSWLLSAYGPMAGLSALCDVTGLAPALGLAASVGSAVLGPAVASYTGVLIADTAVPAWHEGYRELPFVFVASGATAAAGLGMLGAPLRENAPARRLALLGAAGELVAAKMMERRLEMLAEPFKSGRSGLFMRAGQVLTIAGVLGATVAGRTGRLATIVSGAALLGASACTRRGIFDAGIRSSEDPRYSVVPQRARVEARRAAPRATEVP